ncbi:hypothetical protein ACFSR7_09145 [Cohnella sp. GCM10020058]|uniref:hypothetical protein n=1 Tax=Cohnella sp. GCM10020058 TaxID=3317330 RepID=UPI0036299661
MTEAAAEYGTYGFRFADSPELPLCGLFAVGREREISAAYRWDGLTRDDGTDARLVTRDGDRIVWTSNGPDGVRYVALFNVGDAPLRVGVVLEALGWNDGAAAVAFDMWAASALEPVGERLELEVASHGARLVRLS